MTLKIGIHAGPQEIAFDELTRLWKRAESAGFHWISVWDHFYANPIEESRTSCFEGVASMAALAAMTSKVRVGCLVFCALFRNPGLLAKAAVTIDHISNGRAELGLGGGWLQEEFDDYGYAFPPIKERLDQLEEALQVVRALLHEGSVSFQGRYYRFEGTVCAPMPKQKKLRIWVGGKGKKRTPNLAARYADGFNLPYVSPEEFQDRNRTVDRFCDELDRNPAEIERSVNIGFYMGANERAIEKNKEGLERFKKKGVTGLLAGTPAEAVDTIGKYVDAGAQGLNIAFRPPIDWEAFEAFIEQVLPHFHR